MNDFSGAGQQRPTRVSRASRRSKGATLLYMLVLLPVLCGLASLMVDYGLASLVKSQLETAVDAAAMAASRGLATSPAAARSLAESVAASNKVNLQPLILIDSDIQFGTWVSSAKTFTVLTGASESQANAVRVNGQLSAQRGTSLNLFFLPLLQGASSLQLSASATAQWSGDRVDWIMIQDLSMSFTPELPQAKTGDQDILNYLNSPGSQANFGLVGFTGWGKTIAGLQPVTNSYTSLSNAISSMSINGTGMPPAGTGSDIAAGIEQAQSMFNAAGQTTHSRSMIIVSDGQPNASSSGSHPTMSDNQLLSLAQQDADTAWGQGINVYVIWWDSSNGADLTSGSNLQSLVRGRGTYAHVTDPSLLPAAIQSVLAGRPELVK